MPALAEDDKNILSQQNYNTIEVNENNLRNNQNQQTNENKYNFVHSVGVLFGVSYGVSSIWFLIFTNLINLIEIIIGSMYLYDCQIRPGIPALLIINGTIRILASIVVEANNYFRHKNIEEIQNNGFSPLVTFFGFASIVAFLLLCVEVYGSPQPNNNHDCNLFLYGFAYWLLNIYMIAIGFAVAIYVGRKLHERSRNQTLV